MEEFLQTGTEEKILDIEQRDKYRRFQLDIWGKNVLSAHKSERRINWEKSAKMKSNGRREKKSVNSN